MHNLPTPFMSSARRHRQSLTKKQAAQVVREGATHYLLDDSGWQAHEIQFDAEKVMKDAASEYDYLMAERMPLS